MPMKTLELHYPMIQFLIILDIPQFQLGNIRSRDLFRPIARERKYLMDYKIWYLPPSNSEENGVLVCIRDKWRNIHINFFVVYIILMF